MTTISESPAAVVKQSHRLLSESFILDKEQGAGTEKQGEKDFTIELKSFSPSALYLQNFQVLKSFSLRLSMPVV